VINIRLTAKALVLLLCAVCVGAYASNADDISDLADYGIFYDRYEPSFYTGFGPRSNEPERLHLHVGRGNQLRMTLVLSDDVLETYASNLLTRYETYRYLVDSGRIQLTQNDGFAAFETTIKQIDLETVVAGQRDAEAEVVRKQNLALMEELNPGRVFRIRIAIDDLLRKWAGELTPSDHGRISAARNLELVNLLLPTRLWVTKLDQRTSSDLKTLVALAPKPGGMPSEAFRAAYLALFEKVSNGIYPMSGDHLEFAEFTAIHPVGTLNAYTTYKGRKIPQYPTPGRRAFTYHQRSRTVDHIPTIAIYSYLPWLPYMHVGPKLHNSFHSLWWRMNPAQAKFLPATITRGDRSHRDDGAPYQRLWLLSRGPMSHGCTHVNAGHISELREILPATPELMSKVDAFINKSHQFDVFDIDGDLTPEVIGVRYFVAYSLRDKQPDRLRAPIERRAYYDWLYGGEAHFASDGSAWFEDVDDTAFSDRYATNGRHYGRVRLYEANYEPEKIQFYKMVDIPFARELRQVSADHPFAQQLRQASTVYPFTGGN